MKKVLRFRVTPSAVFLLCIAMTITASAQTFTNLLSFEGADGSNPWYGSLVQGPDGYFYGTTVSGGAYAYGTVFKMTSLGAVTTLHSFDSTDGSGPQSGLFQGTDGAFYGTTPYGGANYFGTVFKVTAEGTFTTLHSFDLADGAYPYSALVEGRDGNFYGTTFEGGTNQAGTVFKMTPAGTLTTLYSFCAQSTCPDGSSVYSGLVQGPDGSFFGTTYWGGTYGYGTIFSVTSGGTLTTLHNFFGDGAHPVAGLVQGTDGYFYGTTLSGGAYRYGTVFKMTSLGAVTILHSFDSTDGADPYGGLVEATDGNLYGTTEVGGPSNDGTVFRTTTGGTLTNLHNFDGTTDGYYPYAGLIQGTDGNIYGTTLLGGTYGDGTVFSVSVGLGPFVETLPTGGKVGSKVVILGNALTGATSVTFNGTPATFTVVSPTEIKTTVPTGATSGKVQVTTPHGTLTSNVVFRVK